MSTHRLVVLAAIVGVTSSACEAGWQEIGGKCYKLLPTPATWTEQDKACYYIGARLASIKSAAENEAVKQVAGGREIYTGGLSYHLSPWSWADLTPFGSYKNWVAGSEPPISPYKPCIKMNTAGQWFSNCCRVPPAPAVCSKSA